jgi:hypothetical protein
MYCKPERILPGSALALLCLVSCVTQPQTSPFAPVYVTDWALFTLLPAAGLEQPLDGPQQFSGTFGSQEFIMEAWVRADETGVVMALYNSMGADMGSFVFTDTQVSFQSPVFPPSFRAEYLAADFQFCFYRPGVLQEALEKSGLVFEVLGAQVSRREIRRIRAGETIIIEIEKTERLVRYRNFLRGYSYTLAGAL